MDALSLLLQYILGRKIIPDDLVRFEHYTSLVRHFTYPRGEFIEHTLCALAEHQSPFFKNLQTLSIDWNLKQTDTTLGGILAPTVTEISMKRYRDFSVHVPTTLGTLQSLCDRRLPSLRKLSLQHIPNDNFVLVDKFASVVASCPNLAGTYACLLLSKCSILRMAPNWDAGEVAVGTDGRAIRKPYCKIASSCCTLRLSSFVVSGFGSGGNGYGWVVVGRATQPSRGQWGRTAPHSSSIGRSSGSFGGIG